MIHVLRHSMQSFANDAPNFWKYQSKSPVCQEEIQSVSTMKKPTSQTCCK